MGEVVKLSDFQRPAASVPQVNLATSPMVSRKPIRDSFSPAVVGLAFFVTASLALYGAFELYKQTPSSYVSDPGIGPGPMLFRP